LRTASSEWITSVSRGTSTNRIVVLHCAMGSNSTSVGARISTLLLSASLVQGTLGADHALRSAARRGANIGRQARAHSLFVDFSALTVWSTRGWRTGISFRPWWHYRFNFLNYLTLFIYCKIIYRSQVQFGRKRTGHQCSQVDSHKLARDSKHCRWHRVHKFQGKGRRICSRRKP